jgi:hypothetical protein
MTITLIICAVLIAFGVGRFLRQQTIEINNESLLESWLQHAAAFGTDVDLHLHIRKHADELLTGGYGTYSSWSASMRNLLDIFNKAHGIEEADVELRLSRMMEHYLRDPTKNTPPPGALPKSVVDRASRKRTYDSGS